MTKSARDLSTCRLLVAQAQGSNKLLGIGQVGVWVAAAKVLLGVTIQQRALGRSELLQQRLRNVEPPDISIAYSAKISAALPFKQYMVVIRDCGLQKKASSHSSMMCNAREAGACAAAVA